jgi:hypothetical protein
VGGENPGLGAYALELELEGLPQFSGHLGLLAGLRYHPAVVVVGLHSLAAVLSSAVRLAPARRSLHPFRWPRGGPTASPSWSSAFKYIRCSIFECNEPRHPPMVKSS